MSLGNLQWQRQIFSSSLHSVLKLEVGIGHAHVLVQHVLESLVVPILVIPLSALFGHLFTHVCITNCKLLDAIEVVK